MAIARRGTPTSAFDTASATSRSISVPSGVVDGDVLILCVTGDGGANSNPTVTTPTGWNLLDSAIQGSRQVLAVFWRAASSEPSSYTITTSSGKFVLEMAAYSGADSTTPFGTRHSLKTETVAGTGHTTNSVTPSATTDWEIAFFADRSTTSGSKNTNWTPTSPATERLEQSNNTNGSSAWINLECCDDNADVGSTSGQTRTSTSTISTSNALQWIGSLAAASGGTPQNINLGELTETDSLLSPATSKSALLNELLETESLLAEAATKTALLGELLETDSLFSMTNSSPINRNLGLLSELDALTSPLTSKDAALGLLTSTPSLLSISAQKAASLGILTQSGALLPVTYQRAVLLGLLSEADALQAMQVMKAMSILLGLLAETDQMLGIPAPGGLRLNPVGPNALALLEALKRYP